MKRRAAALRLRDKLAGHMLAHTRKNLKMYLESFLTPETAFSSQRSAFSNLSFGIGLIADGCEGSKKPFSPFQPPRSWKVGSGLAVTH